MGLRRKRSQTGSVSLTRRLHVEQLELRHMLDGAAVAISIVATDLDGHPISSIDAGHDFKLQAWVQDLRSVPNPDSQGLFAAYIDVSYAKSLAAIAKGTQLSWGSQYGGGANGDLSKAGLIAHAGGFHPALIGPGNSSLLLWSIVVHAKAGGTASFVPKLSPIAGYDTLLYGVNDAIATSQVEFHAVTLQINGSGNDPVAPPSDDDIGAPPPPDNRLPSHDGDMNGPAVAITLLTKDLNGKEISSIQTGGDFVIQAWVQDLRKNANGNSDAEGVFSAYLDVTFAKRLANLAPGTSFTFGSVYRDITSGSADTPGQIANAGGAHLALAGNGTSAYLLWSVVVHARSGGQVTFVPSLSKQIGDDTLLYGQDTPVSVGQVVFKSTSITINGPVDDTPDPPIDAPVVVAPPDDGGQVPTQPPPPVVIEPPVNTDPPATILPPADVEPPPSLDPGDIPPIVINPWLHDHYSIYESTIIYIDVPAIDGRWTNLPIYVGDDIPLDLIPRDFSLVQPIDRVANDVEVMAVLSANSRINADPVGADPLVSIGAQQPSVSVSTAGSNLLAAISPGLAARAQALRAIVAEWDSADDLALNAPLVVSSSAANSAARSGHDAPQNNALAASDQRARLAQKPDEESGEAETGTALADPLGDRLGG